MALSYDDAVKQYGRDTVASYMKAKKYNPSASIEDFAKSKPSTAAQTQQTPQTPTVHPATFSDTGVSHFGSGVLGTLGSIGSAVSNFGLGAIKGVMDVPREFASLGESIGAGASNLLDSARGITREPSKASDALKQGVQQTSLTKPVGTAQNVGYGTEKIAEFFVPIGGAAKAAELVNVAKGTTEAEKAANLGKHILDFVKGTGKEAGSFAARSAVQQGNLDNVGMNAALGAATHGISSAVGGIISKTPDTAWSAILKLKPSSAIKNPNLVSDAAKTGITAMTQKGVLKEAQTGVQSVEVALDDLLSGAEGKVSGEKVASYLDDLKQSYAGIPGEEGSISMIDKIQKETAALGDIDAKKANELKRNIYQIINDSYGKGNLDIPAKTAAQKQVARGLKTEIEAIIPEAKSLNEKQAVYLGIAKAIKQRMARESGKGIAGTGIGLYDLLTGGIASMFGSPVMGAAVLGLKKASETPAVLSSVSKLAKYFDTLSPTKKLLFYQAIRGILSQMSQETSK
jgi:hypothetical protein